MSQKRFLIPRDDGITEIGEVDVDGRLVIHKRQREERFEAAVQQRAEDNAMAKSGYRYNGSIPLLVAEIWQQETGLKIGTREFMDYAKRRLQSGDFSKLLGRPF